MKTCLSIAGSDSSGGAGVQADLKTFAAHSVYGMSAITAVTAQNTIGVHGVSVLDADFVAQQIQVVFDDIKPDAVKIGMLANTDVVSAVASQLRLNRAKNIVLDPVMLATAGDPLLDAAAVHHLVQELLPHVTLVTPNVPELLALCKTQNIAVDHALNHQQLDKDTMASLSQAFFDSLSAISPNHTVNILTKGGHLNDDTSPDLLITTQGKTWLDSPRIDTNNTHGTGCTLSAAICSQLAKDESLEAACKSAKAYLNRALRYGLNLGSGAGPLNHACS